MGSRRTRTVVIHIPVSFTIDEVTDEEAEDIAISFVNVCGMDKKLSEFLKDQNDNPDVRKIKVLEIE
jgi:hypothetical protein